MPIYEYQCQACAGEVEVLQKISDAPLVDCPACGQSALRKKVSAAAFRLKGGGWYETDFKTGSKKNIAGGESSEKGGAAGTGEKKTGDSKPAGSKPAESKPAESKKSA